MKVLDLILRFLLRFRYPATLPEDIAADLGFNTSNFITFKEFVEKLTSHRCSQRLTRFMPREAAEAVFQSALRKERFRMNSLFSYYFHEGWLEFILQFDAEGRLRRIYLQHKLIRSETGIEIPL